MDKVKLPKNIGTYIEDLLINSTNEMFLAGVLGSANSPKYVAIREYFKDRFDSLLLALVNGYEVEETPEDKVRELYKNAEESVLVSHSKGNKEEIQFYRGKMAAITQALDCLGIKIEGVTS